MPASPASVRIDRQPSPAGAIEMVTADLPPPLRGVAGRVVGFDLPVAPGAVHLGLPTTSLPLVLSFGEPQTIASPRAEVGAVTVHAFASGVHEGVARITAPRFTGIQLDLTPLGAVRLLGRPLADLTDRCVALDDLVGAELGRDLPERLAAARTWADRFALVTDALTRRLTDPAPAVRPEVVETYRRVVASGGRVEVQRLAAELGWSRRHLTGRFTATFGVPPKRFARLVRFERAVRLLERADRPPLADVAAVTGYSDQAHLTREVRALTGLPPAQLRRRHDADDGWWERR